MWSNILSFFFLSFYLWLTNNCTLYQVKFSYKNDESYCKYETKYIFVSLFYA